MLAEQKAAILIIVQAGMSPFMWGNPGQGKSALVRLGFTKLGYAVHVIRVNTILPHHLGGSPLPHPGGEMVRFVPPEWAIELNKSGKAVLLLDDLSCATPMGQMAALGILDERMIGGFHMDNVIPIAAANPNSVATQRFDLDAAAANRCVHVFITSDPESFRKDVAAGFPAPIVPVVGKDWKKFVERHSNRITSFLCSNDGAGLVNKMPEQITPETVAWPSERTWEKCWQLMAACDAIDPESAVGINMPEVKRILFRGCVGAGAQKAFINHFLKPMEASANDALKQGRHYVFPKEGDKLFGLLGAVVEKLEASLDEKKWEQAWGLLEALFKDGQSDRGITFALDLLSINKERFRKPPFYEQTIRGLLAAGKK